MNDKTKKCIWQTWYRINIFCSSLNQIQMARDLNGSHSVRQLHVNLIYINNLYWPLAGLIGNTSKKERKLTNNTRNITTRRLNKNSDRIQIWNDCIIKYWLMLGVCVMSSTFSHLKAGRAYAATMISFCSFRKSAPFMHRDLVFVQVLSSKSRLIVLS